MSTYVIVLKKEGTPQEEELECWKNCSQNQATESKDFPGEKTGRCKQLNEYDNLTSVLDILNLTVTNIEGRRSDCPAVKVSSVVKVVCRHCGEDTDIDSKLSCTSCQRSCHLTIDDEYMEDVYGWKDKAKWTKLG